MAEQHNRPHPPTLDDYQAMMSDLRAPEQLREAVLKEARARRGSASAAATGHGPCRPSALFRHHRTRMLVIAACIALLLGAGTTALALNSPGGFGIVNDLMAEPPTPDENVAKAPEEAKENSMELNASQFHGDGGYSGPWYNPADDSFWSYEWAGYKYHFNIRCEGDNIETITYEIEGERSYFEIIDKTVTQQQRAEGIHVFHYPKTVTFDYNHQESIDDTRIVEIYIGFPLSESGLEAYRRLMAEGHSYEAAAQLDAAIEELHSYMNAERIDSMVAHYRTITEQFVWQMPDIANERLTPAQYDTVANSLSTEIEENYRHYYDSYYYPMPFYIGVPAVQDNKLHLVWDAAYDFDAESLVYTVEVAADYTFQNVLFRQENLMLPEAEMDLLPAGQYFMRVRVTNESGYTQDAFDYYVTDAGKIYGVKCFYVMADGSIAEDIYVEG